MLLTAAQIKANRRKFKTKDVEVPALGGAVRIRSLLSGEWDDYDESLVKTLPNGKRVADAANLSARLVSRCAIDEKGDHLFTEADVAILAEIDAEPINALYLACLEINGRLPKAIEEAKKNSEPTAGSASSSGSPLPLAEPEPSCSPASPPTS